MELLYGSHGLIAETMLWIYRASKLMPVCVCNAFMMLRCILPVCILVHAVQSLQMLDDTADWIGDYPHKYIYI